MRRPARRLFTLCSAASLLLCVAACVLWVLSYKNWRLVSLDGAVYLVVVEPVEGFRRLRGAKDLDTFNHGPTWIRATERGGTVIEVLGVALRHGSFAPAAWFFVVRVPYWLLALLTCIPPSAWLLSARRRHTRAKRGSCLDCGYDLRSSPDRCPECGTAAAVSSVSGAKNIFEPGPLQTRD